MFRNGSLHGVKILAALVGAVLLTPAALTACGNEVEQGGEGGDVSHKVESVAAPRSETGGSERAVAAESVAGEVLPQEEFDRKVVKNAELGITSGDVREGASRAQQLASGLGGTVVSSQTYRADDALYADLVISVPSDEFEGALERLRKLGKKITTDTVSGQDVTGEYVDLKSRERNLLAAEQSLLDLYNRAGNVQDALSIQRELTVVRGQVEEVQGRIEYLEHSSDTSRISLSISPVASPPSPPPAWDPAQTVARAWAASLALLQGLADAVIGTVVFGWWILPLVVAGAWWLRRSLRRSGPAAPAAESSYGEPR